VSEGVACDGAADAACPGRCTSECACDSPPPPGRTYRSIYASGYFGVYDANTVPVWPKRLSMVLGEANAQGPLVANAKQVAATAGNTDARFLFYLSFAWLDSRCGCFDQRFYDSIATAHPEWFLRGPSGARVSTAIDQVGTQREFAVDVGNMAFIDAWADFAFAAMDRYGWDGVWADNVLRGNFDSWSERPVNPRTGAPYGAAEYRKDVVRALQRLRTRFDQRGKLFVGNHSSSWYADTFDDPSTKEAIRAMHGVNVEDCVYTFNGSPHSESNWIAQLRYLDFANRNGVTTQCQGVGGAIADPAKRPFILASYLLTKEGMSNVAQLNNVGSWWSGFETDLGAPLGGFTCLDPAAGLAPTTSCPSPGKIYVREWERGRVLVNPTASASVQVPLGRPLLLNGSTVDAVTLPPRSGAVLLRP
jgi:hypothetical protein